jgi:hypothetical protein
MAQDVSAPQPASTVAPVEASRAWILGLVVEPDGSMSGPDTAMAFDWPAEPDHEPSETTTD